MTKNAVRVIIVDDEELARSIIREHLSRYPDMHIVAECQNGFEAVKAITEQSPDLVFLDIQMPKLDGFEVLSLVERTFAVVFVTAHDAHALKAFEVHAVDYLLKPFGAQRFDAAVQKALASRSQTSDRGPSYDDLTERPVGKLSRILIRDGSKVHVLPVARVPLIEAQDDYVAVHFEGKKYLKQQPMRDLEELLPPDRFVRVHRSTILNVDFLSRIEPYAKDSRVAILKDGSRVNISRAGYDKLKDMLETGGKRTP